MELIRLEYQIGKENLNKIKNTKILVIGLGGVGGYAVESLVRSGIENITLVDADIIEKSNVNRQIIALQSTIGMKKVDAFENRILDINPNAKIKKISEFITKENLSILFENKVDFVIDACDTISTKIVLIEYCSKNDIPIISCMGMGRKLDPSKINIMDIQKTSYDPIAKIIRKAMREKNITSKIPVVSSNEKPLQDHNGTISSNSFVPAVAGLTCTSYVIKQIIGE